MKLLAAVGVVILGCGSGGTAYQLEGDCDPPAGAAPITPLGTYTLGCDLPFQAGVWAVATSQDELTALLGTCAAPVPPGPIDFTAAEVLLVRGYTGDGSAEVDFLVDDGARLELGIRYRPSGYPFPNLMLVVPRSDRPVEARLCRTVCVEGCDQAIP